MANGTESKDSQKWLVLALQTAHHQSEPIHKQRQQRQGDDDFIIHTRKQAGRRMSDKNFTKHTHTHMQTNKRNANGNHYGMLVVRMTRKENLKLKSSSFVVQGNDAFQYKSNPGMIRRIIQPIERLSPLFKAVPHNSDNRPLTLSLSLTHSVCISL